MENDELTAQMREIERGEAAGWIDYADPPAWFPVYFGAYGAILAAAIGYLDGWVAALVEVALVGSALILITRMRRRRGTWPTGNAPRELRRSTAVLVGGAIAVGLLCWLVGAQVSVFAAVVLAGVLSAALVVWYRREYAAGVAAVRRRLA